MMALLGKYNNIKSLLLYLTILTIICECKKTTKKTQVQQKTVTLGETHTFLLTKYQKPQQFTFLASCKQNAYINFELSPRLKLRHRHIFLTVDFETHQCIQTHQDANWLLLNNDQSWDLSIQNSCCSGENSTKVYNQTINVIVRDGFKIGGISIKTKTWNIVIPIITSILICAFIWFSNFSQPRALNVSLLSRFYKQTKPQIKKSLRYMTLSIDKQPQDLQQQSQPNQIGNDNYQVNQVNQKKQ